MRESAARVGTLNDEVDDGVGDAAVVGEAEVLAVVPVTYR